MREKEIYRLSEIVMVEAEIIRMVFPGLKIYHLGVSLAGSICCVAGMQQVRDNGRRLAMGALSIALFCSGLRVPELAACSPLTLLSASSVNTAVLFAVMPIGFPDWRELFS